MVLQKAGAVEETKDTEFNSLASAFERTASSTQRLADEIKRYGEAIEAQLTHHIGLLQAWQRTIQTNGEYQRRLGSLIEAARGCQRRLLDEWEVSIEVPILKKILPTLLTAQQAITGKITKRNHKLIDYDRHRHSAKKLGASEQTRSLSDERRLVKTEQALDQAEDDYIKYNERLKEDIPQFLALHGQLLQPVLTTLVIFQQRFYRELDALRTIIDGGRREYSEILSSFEEDSSEALLHLREIPLLQTLSGKRPAKSAERGTATPTAGTTEATSRLRSRTASSTGSFNSCSSDSSSGKERETVAASKAREEQSMKPVPPRQSHSAPPLVLQAPQRGSPTLGSPADVPTRPIERGKPRETGEKAYLEVYAEYKSKATEGESFYDCQEDSNPWRSHKKEPTSLARELKERVTSSVPPPAARSPSPPMVLNERKGGRVAELAAKLGSLGLQGAPPANTNANTNANANPSNPSQPLRHPSYSPQARSTKDASGRVMAVALYDFVGQEAEDLSFRVGDRIEILKRTVEANDWWTGALNGRRGVFPGTYVRILE